MGYRNKQVPKMKHETDFTSEEKQKIPGLFLASWSISEF